MGSFSPVLCGLVVSWFLSLLVDLQSHWDETLIGIESTRSSARVLFGCLSGIGGVPKVIVEDHVVRHVVGPFQDLGSNVDEECV